MEEQVGALRKFQHFCVRKFETVTALKSQVEELQQQLTHVTNDKGDLQLHGLKAWVNTNYLRNDECCA